LAFARVKFHKPILLPAYKLVEILLECVGILGAGYGPIHYGVVGKYTYFRLDTLRKIIDVDEKQNWSKYRTLGDA
jgi:hypothetical protein